MMNSWSRFVKGIISGVAAIAMVVPAEASDYTMTITQPTSGEPFTAYSSCAVIGNMSWKEMWPTEGVPDVMVKAYDNTANAYVFTWWGPATTYGWYSGTFACNGCSLGGPGTTTIKVYAYDGMNYMGILTGVNVTMKPLPMP